MSNDCIGCGYCCAKAPCAIGYQLHGEKAPCPELGFVSGRHWCMWVIKQELKNDEAEGVMAHKALDIGEGCCSPLNSWRRESLEDRTKSEEGGESDPNMQNVPPGVALLRKLFGGFTPGP